MADGENPLPDASAPGPQAVQHPAPADRRSRVRPLPTPPVGGAHEREVVLSQVAAALAYVGRDLHYRYANQRFADWIGRSLDAIIGRHVQEVLPAPMYEFLLQHIERTLSGEVSRYEREFTAPNGRKYWIRGVHVPDFAEDGSVRGYVLLSLDITPVKRVELALERERAEYAARLEAEVEIRTRELKALQRRLVQSERLSAAEKMAGSVVHAVRNPLQALLGQVQMALTDTVDSRLALERIHDLAHRIENVVEGTLRLVRGGAMELETQSCTALIERVVREVEPRAARSRVKLEARLAPDLPPLSADHTLLAAALTGITDNAIQASPAGGKVQLEVEAVRSPSIVRFKISDRGSGIPEAIRPRILEPFFTTKGGGAGLGLAIANGVVEGHQGTLRFDARPGGGTIVAVELPLGDLFHPK